MLQPIPATLGQCGVHPGQVARGQRSHVIAGTKTPDSLTNRCSSDHHPTFITSTGGVILARSFRPRHAGSVPRSQNEIRRKKKPPHTQPQSCHVWCQTPWSLSGTMEHRDLKSKRQILSSFSEHGAMRVRISASERLFIFGRFNAGT